MEATRRRRLEDTERIHSNRATASRTGTAKRRHLILARPAAPMAHLPTTPLHTADIAVGTVERNMALLHPTQAGNSERRHEQVCS